MAPPTIAPPIRPAATPAATPRWALAGLEARAPASVATARKAEIVFFMFWSLLEMAPEIERRGLGSTHPYLELTAWSESAQPSTWSKRCHAMDGKTGFFVPNQKRSGS